MESEERMSGSDEKTSVFAGEPLGVGSEREGCVSDVAAGKESQRCLSNCNKEIQIEKVESKCI